MIKFMSVITRTPLFTIVFFSLLLGGCATTNAPSGDEDIAALFYPPLPNPPRLQYLTSFSGSKDVEKKGGGLEQLITGADTRFKFIEKTYGVNLHDGKIYATDIGNSSYVVMDLVNREYKQVHGKGGGVLRIPANIVIDTDGTKYVTDAGRMQILQFDRDDKFIRALGYENQFKPVDVEIHGDRLYVADQKEHDIVVLDKKTGEELFRFGADSGDTDDKEKWLFTPTSLEIYNNRLYVVEMNNTRVKEYTLEGEVIRNIGSVGLSYGQFVRPKGMAIDKDGVMYVVDAGVEKIQLWSLPLDQPLMAFSEPGPNRGNINLPADIEINYDDVEHFQQYADPDFELEYVILVTSQIGPHKVSIWGFGRLRGMDYPDTEELLERQRSE
ncbi:MAG: hypothetical protein HUJ31_14445 [Pseudomonadales bacterium]|nr:hypothetical protein [Pseudomonadales bacterium]